MDRNNHKRSKFGDLPGDISKKSKIELLEKGKTKGLFGDVVDKKHSFKKILRSRERARLKERTQQTIATELS